MVYREPAPLRCVECKTELAPAGVGKFRFENCSTCESAWVSTAMLEAMLAEMKPGNHLTLLLVANAKGRSCKGSAELRFRVRNPHDVETIQVAGPIIKIGRLSSAHVRLVDNSVSRLHAVIEITDDHARLIDLGSALGTRVNGELVSKHDLRFGDLIGVGVFELQIQASENREQVEVSARHCPQCQTPMRLMLLDDVEVDSCRQHGVWFDVSELQRVLLHSSK